jgi:hypothetical protein
MTCSCSKSQQLTAWSSRDNMTRTAWHKTAANCLHSHPRFLLIVHPPCTASMSGGSSMPARLNISCAEPIMSAGRRTALHNVEQSTHAEAKHTPCLQAGRSTQLHPFMLKPTTHLEQQQQ